MKFCDSEAASCRWSEYAQPFFNSEWDVLFDASEVDYQGTVEVLVRHGWEKKYKYLEYSYGSCSGCDGWEGRPEEEVMADMLRCIQPMDYGTAKAHLQRIADTAKTEDKYDNRDRAKKARAALIAMEAFEAES